MKKLFITMCLMVLALEAKADDAVLVVNFTNGSSHQEFALSDIGKLTFDESSFYIIGTDGAASPFVYGQVGSIKFKGISTGIGAVSTTEGGLKPYYRNGQLGVDGWKAGEKAYAAVYSVDGMTVVSVDHWDGTPFSTGSLAEGVYIFKVNNHTIKFVKQ